MFPLRSVYTAPPPPVQARPCRLIFSLMRGLARAADGVAFTAFLAVPLLVSPAFWDQYVSVKWYALEALAACWLLAETWAGSGGWPRFARENRVLVLPALALGLFSVLRAGPLAA